MKFLHNKIRILLFGGLLNSDCRKHQCAAREKLMPVAFVPIMK